MNSFSGIVKKEANGSPPSYDSPDALVRSEPPGSDPETEDVTRSSALWENLSPGNSEGITVPSALRPEEGVSQSLRKVREIIQNSQADLNLRWDATPSSASRGNTSSWERSLPGLVSQLLDVLDNGDSILEVDPKCVAAAAAWLQWLMLCVSPAGRTMNQSKTTMPIIASKQLAQEILRHDGVETLLCACMGCANRNEWDVVDQLWSVIQCMVEGVGTDSIKSSMRWEDGIFILDAVVAVVPVVPYCPSIETSTFLIVARMLRTMAALLQSDLVNAKDFFSRRVIEKVLVAIKRYKGRWAQNELLARSTIYFFSVCSRRADLPWTKSQYNDVLPVIVELLTAFPSHIGLRFLKHACAKS